MGKFVKGMKETLLLSGCVLFLASCGSENSSVDLTEKEAQVLKYEAVTAQEESGQREIVISIPESSEISGYVVYKDTVYYSLEYTTLFEDNTGTGVPEFTKEYSTQICAYDIKTGSGEVLYQYDNDYCIHVTDMQCNGEKLIWEDYPKEKIWNVKCMNLADGQTKDILSQAEGESGFDTITPRITEKGIYFYNNDENNKVNLLYYEFENNTTTFVAEDVYLMSPYIKPAVVNGVLSYCRQEEGETRIIMVDLSSQKETGLKVAMDVRDAMSDGKVCVWMTGYGTEDEVYVYDLSAKELQKISTGNIFSYAVSEGKVVINERNAETGIWLYDTEKETKSCLFDGTECYFGFTNIGYENNIYAEQSDGTGAFHLIEIK